jgi:hypothetical protein
VEAAGQLLVGDDPVHHAVRQSERARGGELITLLWALLNHVGIVSRTTSDDAARAAAGTSTPGVISNI